MESSRSLFAVIRRYGPPYDPQKPLEAQPEWEAHRVFMNALEAEGLARLAGPLEETAEVLLIFRGENKEEIDRRLKADLWDPLDRADSTVGICGSARWRRAAFVMSMPNSPRRPLCTASWSLGRFRVGIQLRRLSGPAGTWKHALCDVRINEL